MSGRSVATATGEVGFRFDLNQCTGCNACELACSIENELGWGRSWRQVLTFNPDKIPSLPTYHLSLACNHCREAPCISACPARAIARDSPTGAVLIAAALCLGCRYCSWACPYGAPTFDAGAGLMGKCTWCRHRLVENRQPACVEQCPTGALAMGPLQGREAVAGFPQTPARPAIRFEPLQPLRQEGPECSWQVPAEIVDSFREARPMEGETISLRREWPLLIFSLVVSLLVGWVVASLGRVAPPTPGWFLSLAGAAGGASLLHLGRKLRAWRAVLNPVHSWLSREVVGFALFVAVSLVYSAGPRLPTGVLAAALGLSTLFAIDRVYDFVRPARGPVLHSADTLLTGLLMATLLSRQLLPAASLLIVKAALFGARAVRRDLPSEGPPPWARHLLAGSRLLLGLALPLVLWTVAPGTGFGISLGAIALAEVLDRASFYQGLAIHSPRRQLLVDEARLRSCPRG